MLQFKCHLLTFTQDTDQMFLFKKIFVTFHHDSLPSTKQYLIQQSCLHSKYLVEYNDLRI